MNIILQFFDNFEVDTFDPLLSDKHNPIILKMMDLSNHTTVMHEKVVQITKTLKVKWNKDVANDFLNNIEGNAVDVLLSEVNRMEGQNVNQVSVDNVACSIKDIYLDAAQKSGMLKSYKKSTTLS